MKSIFETPAYNEIITRLEALKGDVVPQWGKMNGAQMLAHCKEPLKTALGKSTLKRPNFLMQLLFKSIKKSMYSDKPWKKNLPTAREYKVIDEKDFTEEKNELRTLIEELYAKRNMEEWPIHPVWGAFTPEQWGKFQYKHLDHHFRQFNV